ncbi:hypothetical protein RUM43_005290 [Polyplax serrata]|uniref:Uncharacterized protein n=1 Tax=Polyplax serrata TaxID=468196 RepID=A0AAN8S8L4_POLSC
MLEKCILSLVPLLCLVNCKEDKVVYKFQEFFYKGNTKNGVNGEHKVVLILILRLTNYRIEALSFLRRFREIAFREFESACEQSPDCISEVGPARSACVQRCISPSCHQDLYGDDPLEEGEIDVRLNSFKGCFVQRLNRPRQ